MTNQLDNHTSWIESLDAAGDNLHTVLDHFTDVFYLTDGAGVIRFISGAIHHHLGYKPEEMVGRLMSDFYVEADDRTKVLSALAANPGKITNVEFQLRRKNGDVTWASTDARLILDKAGLPLGVEGVSRDITDRKLAELALEEREAKLRLSEIRHRRLVENSPDILYSFSDSAGGNFYSPRVKDILGYSAEYLRENPLLWHDSIHPEDLPAVDKAIGEMAEHKPFDLEYRIRDASGNWIWLHDRSMASWSADNERIVEGLATNVTGRKQADEQIRKAMEAAYSANNAKTEFLRSMSHELRTPLNAILGFAQILQSDTSPPLSNKQVEYMQHILDGGDHLLELVNQVLDLARIETDQVTFVNENFVANALIAECVNLMLPIGSAHAVKIINKISNAPGINLYGNPLRLKQVLINLLSNAVKYNRKNGTVIISEQSIDSSVYRLSVSDTGVGIAEEHHSDVFRMFHRFSAGSRDAPDGHGIGLTVSKALIEGMGGTIGFKSREGEGSTFWIELPAATKQSQAG